jgi:hypothetical protein
MADVLKRMGLVDHKVAVGTCVFLFEMLHQTALADWRREKGEIGLITRIKREKCETHMCEGIPRWWWRR